MNDLLDIRNREMFLDWSWETIVESRKSRAVYDRLARIYYVTDTTILRVVQAAAEKAFKPSRTREVNGSELTCLACHEVHRWRMFRVVLETYMGGHDIYHVIVGDMAVSDHATLAEAKAWMTNKAKQIQARLDLTKYNDQ